MNVLIINQHANNLGDEAAAIALIEKLGAYKNCNKIFLNYIGQGKLHYENEKLVELEFRIRKIGFKKAVLKIICNYLSIPYKGNGLIQELSEVVESSAFVFVSPSGADLGHYKGWGALLNILLIKSYRKNIVFHLNSIDKCNNFFFEKLKLHVLKDSMIYVREKRSKDYLMENGIDSIWGIDTAFALKSSGEIKSENIITFVFSKYDFMFSEEEKNCIEKNIEECVLKQLVKYANEENMRVQILPHLLTKDEEEYLSNLEIFLNNYIPGIAFYNKQIENALDYQKAIGKSYCLIGMRYHAIVLAAKNSIPFISLSYDSKMDELTDYLNMQNYNVNLFDLKEDTIPKKLKAIENRYLPIKAELEKVVNELLDTTDVPTRDVIGAK